jgi:hypothetical protein
VRIRRRKPWVLARRRLFGWKVRLLTRCLRNCQAGRRLIGRVGKRARFGRHRKPGIGITGRRKRPKAGRVNDTGAVRAEQTRRPRAVGHRPNGRHRPRYCPKPSSVRRARTNVRDDTPTPTRILPHRTVARLLTPSGCC